MSKEPKEFKNPQEYSYKGNEEIKLPAYQFKETIKLVNETLLEEMKEYYPEPRKWVNKSNEDASKKEIESGEAFEVLDIEKLFQHEEPQIMYTKKGVKLLRLKFLLEQIHQENVETGVAKHISELKREFEESQKSQLKKVED
jgi:hypothetical protein